MKTKIFYTSEPNLIRAIKSLCPKNIKPKDYEYFISIYAKRVFENHYKKPFYITFEVNDKYQNIDGPAQLTSEQTVEILRTQLKEQTPVDFGLAPITESGDFEGYAYPFQIKRFIGNSSKIFIEELIKFIERKAGHYRSPKTSLIVILELRSSGKNLQTSKLKTNFVKLPDDFFRDIADKLRVDKKSLRSVLIFTINRRQPELTQVWPNYGEYKLDTMIYKLRG